ncbi:NAD(P)-dependent alcohol dehydrogenase [Novosphingobium sp. 9U]|uniref:zinc-dependent alcohol dehydrogenase family protein n=1 Tax=Novosphingobium sp. 9U TaxID=2653158 RepID=UPI0012F04832|nr:Alcohol dehydrogenase [Novosphingobium sp. 9U]
MSDGAGEVIEVGQGVTEFTPRDRVVTTFDPKWLAGHIDRAQLDNTPGGPADGFACEDVTRPPTHFTRAPANLSHEEAATLTCAGVTAWRAVMTDGQVKPGDRVLVQGTGGVSLFALQFAKAAGATVIATSSSPAKLARLSALGADHVIDHVHAPEWAQAVLDLTGGLGVEHLIEVGGPNTMRQSFLAALTGAHVAIIGAIAEFETDATPFAVAQAKRLRLQGVTVGSRSDQVEMVRAIDAHAIHPVLDRIFPLTRLADAIRHFQSGGHFGEVGIAVRRPRSRPHGVLFPWTIWGAC